jgi:hypothetical protein
MTESTGPIRWLYPAVGGIIAEGLTIASIILVAGVTGHGAPLPDGSMDPVAATIAAVIGPGVGSILCYLLGWWAARQAGNRFELHGGLVGASAALLTGVGAFAGPPGHAAAYAAAIVLKLLAGRAGGATARRMASRSGQDPAASDREMR